ncbi:putative metal-dependent phosphoesterase, PHP family [Halobacteroides halobius DSM 5150]|uniref:Putative metal-dependent phosphoesterase, PHP family n=1 Tax=Halobacteroides halobius (strain ATCC 35273 / DSM 5150 / MD-1) TaxID=748449 RepID=L0K6P9_HALHC|nr:PHP domain-containing protein [Halobacteroides halobius]AGB40942.1 putative metal-dependent phosphoesterase, PHP family [Halobacteroides halobius DSM 5150]
MVKKYIDLHLHTTASDGSFTPTELVTKAKELGFSAIAITDHDTVDGLEEGAKVAREKGIEFVPGIELNTDYQDAEVHVLGYYIDYQQQSLKDKLATLKEARFNRIKKMVNKLNNLGLEIQFKEVTNLADQAALGRVHLAKVMLNKGYVKEWEEAFDQYIGRSAPAYVKRKKLTPFQAIDLIKKAGGIPIIAHPGLVSRQDLLSELVAAGAKGLEAYHTEHNQEEINHYLQLAKEKNLLITGGSDCHGPTRKTGMLLGEIKAPYSLLEKLKEVR